MEVIKSESNSKVKRVAGLLEKSKNRDKEGSYICEGIRMVSEAPDEDLLEVIVSESFYGELKKGDFSVSSSSVSENRLKELMDSDKVVVIADNLFKKISKTVTPQGIMAEVKKKNTSLDDIISLDNEKNDLGLEGTKSLRRDKNLILILEDIQDPGNMGTIIRTAEAAGVRGLVLSKGCVDIYNPKVVRSTMGSLFRSNIYISDDLIKDVDNLKKTYRIYAAHLKGEKYHNETDYPKNYGFIIGNEGRGISDELSEIAHEYVKIPMYGKAESLNAAIAAAVLMYA